MKKPFAIVLDPNTSLQNQTGSWRNMKPKYVDRLPPCNVACPSGENIQKWLSLMQEGKTKQAWEEIMLNNPFPAVMGRVCYHTCEKACNRSQFDGAVNINLIERSIGDVAITNNWKTSSNCAQLSGKKVLIIGAGPSGLSAAYFLKLSGCDVTIYESKSQCGGMMRYGVPKYRLPRKILDAEIKRILDLGVKLECNKHVSNIKSELQNFDAVYVATGAHVPAAAEIKFTNDKNEKKIRVFDAIDMLRKIEDSEFEVNSLGQNVVVYGGGNTAIDVARTAIRFGANVRIVYRRTIHNMPAHNSEIEDALAEGVEILCLRTIDCIDGSNVILNKMNYDEENEILTVTGEKETVAIDSLIIATGQSIDLALFDEIDIVDGKSIVVDANLMTNIEGIFAGGDVVKGKRTVTHAIGFGKKAAKCINAFLVNEQPKINTKNEIASFKKLNTEYYKKQVREDVNVNNDLSFNEKNISYSAEKMVFESERCFSCGSCFHCDNCYGFCPDNAIIKHADGSLEFNYDYCKGCGICAVECPCGAIRMVDEDED